MAILKKQSDIECPDANVYTLVLIDVSKEYEVESTFKPGRMVKKLDFTFSIVDFDYDPEVDERDWNGFEVTNRYTNSLSERSNLLPVVKALRGGKDVEDGEDLDTDLLLRKSMKATIGPNDNGWPTISSPFVSKRKKRQVVEVVDESEDEEDDELAGTPFEKKVA